MRPANGRVSASSLQTWEECQGKYVAQYVNYIPRGGNTSAADEGTALHYALEHFVQEAIVDKIISFDDEKRLFELYAEGYKLAFKTQLVDKDVFKEAKKILTKWLKRNAFNDVDVLGLEDKKMIPITDLNGQPSYDIELTYIFDRVEFYTESDTGKKILKVVDYKSYRRRLTHDEMRKMIQPMVYAVSALVEFGNLKPDEVWVEIDLLRFDETIGVQFTRDDCIRGWRYLQRTVEEILATDADDPKYKLGPGCKYCPIKGTCPELAKNIKYGGTLGSLVGKDVNELVKMRDELKAASDAAAALVGDIDDQLFEYAKKGDVSSWETDGYEVKLSSYGKRKITDMELVARILGPEIMEQDGKINVTDIDRLEKNGKITPDQARKINAFIQKEYSQPTIKVTKKAPFDE